MERGANGWSHGLVGQSPQICEIRRLIEKLGHSHAPVLLLGESGTGKEVVARAIHDANPTGEFVPIDCGALVGPLVESELFGHTKGAFTGASEAKRGLIEVADGGTAFFDEIGDLPLDMQVKLLRLLQEHEFRPVGSLKQHQVNIRVIAATHHDLARDAVRGVFRQDLYYRLNIVSLRLPALRDRKVDIPELADHFLRRFGVNHRLTSETLDTMMNYDWPGNVRELANSIERMVALNTGPWLHVADLPSPLQNHRPEEPPLTSAVAAGSEAAPLPLLHSPPRQSGLFLATVEKETILKALAATRGDRAKAAHMLGIGRTTLYRKLKEYKIEN
ncbi:MAG TPA: sigma-54 dependent transcriptional regulator [Bryobacteraceae bacterium]|jgi:DNA-binding NtrC family response regulator|nr:sigma-54 dependent transcriptional regulator [Bryobacteraceae bacterium]